MSTVDEGRIVGVVVDRTSHAGLQVCSNRKRESNLEIEDVGHVVKEGRNLLDGFLFLHSCQLVRSTSKTIVKRKGQSSDLLHSDHHGPGDVQTVSGQDHPPVGVNPKQVAHGEGEDSSGRQTFQSMSQTQRNNSEFEDFRAQDGIFGHFDALQSCSL